MPSSEPFLIFTRKSHELGLPDMVTGSISAAYYGEPRPVRGVDIILCLKESDIPRFIKAFPSQRFRGPPVEIIRIEVPRDQRGHFFLIHDATGFVADINLARRDELHVWGLEHLRTITNGGDSINLAPPEYVIVRKLQFDREGRA